MTSAAHDRPTLIQVFLVALPVGLAVAVVVALYIYQLRENRVAEPVAEGVYQKEPTAAALRDYVAKLGGDLVGERNQRDENTLRALNAAASLIEGALGPSNMGYAVHRQKISPAGSGLYNVWVENPGQRNPTEIVEVRVGYDSPRKEDGILRNAIGVAIALELAHAFSNTENRRTVRFVFLANQWDEAAQTKGSEVYDQLTDERRLKVVRGFDLDGDILASYRRRDAISYAALLEEVGGLRAEIIRAANR